MFIKGRGFRKDITPPTNPQESVPREGLACADAILSDYANPSESEFVDMGNLFYAATEYRKAYDKLKAELAEARLEIDIRAKPTVAKLRAEIERLKNEISNCYDVISYDKSVETLIPFQKLISDRTEQRALITTLASALEDVVLLGPDSAAYESSLIATKALSAFESWSSKHDHKP